MRRRRSANFRGRSVRGRETHMEAMYSTIPALVSRDRRGPREAEEEEGEAGVVEERRGERAREEGSATAGQEEEEEKRKAEERKAGAGLGGV